MEEKSNSEMIDGMLEELGVDLEEENLEEENFILIRGKLSYGKLNTEYGLFVVLINKATGGVLKFDLGFSNREEVVYIEPDSEAFKRVFAKLGDEEKFKGRDLKLHLIDDLSKNEIFLLIDSVKNNNLFEVENIFKDKVEAFIREKVDLKLYIEEKKEQEIKRIYPNLVIDNDIDIQNEFEDIKDEMIAIDSSSVVDPFEGKKISELTTGDKILVEINNEIFDKHEDKLNQFFIDSDAQKLVGVIRNIEFNDSIKSYDIFIQLGSKLYSQLVIEAEQELKLATPDNKDGEGEQDISKNNKVHKEDQDGNNEEVKENINDKETKQDIKEQIKQEIEKEVRDEIEANLRTKLKKEIREDIKDEISDVEEKLIFIGFISIVIIISIIIIFLF